MKKLINRKSLQLSATFVTGFMATMPAYAQVAGGGGNNFSTIGTNIITSMKSLPGLLSGVSYMFGIMIGVLGILKIKDHVENPNNTPLKDGAIRLAAGGGLFALPIIYDAMYNTIGSNGTGAKAASLAAVTGTTN